MTDTELGRLGQSGLCVLHWPQSYISEETLIQLRQDLS